MSHLTSSGLPMPQHKYRVATLPATADTRRLEVDTVDKRAGRVDVTDEIANRIIPEVYSSRRKDVFSFIHGAVEASGGRVLYSSPANRAPIYLGVQIESDERLGLLIYAY